MKTLFEYIVNNDSEDSHMKGTKLIVKRPEEILCVHCSDDVYAEFTGMLIIKPVDEGCSRSDHGCFYALKSSTNAVDIGSFRNRIAKGSLDIQRSRRGVIGAWRLACIAGAGKRDAWGWWGD